MTDHNDKYVKALREDVAYLATNEINWRLGCLLPQTIRDHQKMVKIKQRIAELEAAQNETN